MMVRVEKDGKGVLIKDFLVNLYVRNGYTVAAEKKVEEPSVNEDKAEPKRRTVRKTTAKK